MDAIEKRARELLARMEKAKRNERGHWCDARGAVDSACDLLPAIIAALAPQWQPIESAPKDGSMFLCWVSAVRFGTRDDGSLAEEDCSEADFGYWMTVRDGGVFHNVQGEIGDQSAITHWQPLPAPPKRTLEVSNV